MKLLYLIIHYVLLWSVHNPNYSKFYGDHTPTQNVYSISAYKVDKKT
jgi:hypothetical protein